MRAAAAPWSGSIEPGAPLGYQYDKHGPALRLFEEIGGFSAIPDDLKPGIAKWMILCYIGEPGGYGAGVNRKVFYSNSAAPTIEQLFTEERDNIHSVVEDLQDDPTVQRACSNDNVNRRFQDLLDIVGA